MEAFHVLKGFQFINTFKPSISLSSAILLLFWRHARETWLGSQPFYRLSSHSFHVVVENNLLVWPCLHCNDFSLRLFKVCIPAKGLYCVIDKLQGILYANSLSTGSLQAMILRSTLERSRLLQGIVSKSTRHVWSKWHLSSAPLFFVEITSISSRKQVISAPNHVWWCCFSR